MAFSVPNSLVVTLDRVLGNENVGNGFFFTKIFYLNSPEFYNYGLYPFSCLLYGFTIISLLILLLTFLN